MLWTILRIIVGIVFILVGLYLGFTGHPIWLSILGIASIYALGFIFSGNAEFMEWYDKRYTIILGVIAGSWLFLAMDLKFVSSAINCLACIVIGLLITGFVSYTMLDSLLRLGLVPMMLICAVPLLMLGVAFGNSDYY
ncbi:MAG: hypothetical protein LUG60_08135 [Erysipelotrichaceae bacterium]|nr:hypothetical protein [Erysipelotrichaceae bacterium]